MQILELDTIPREPGKLQELISDARRTATRHKMIVSISTIMIFLGMCILLYGFVGVGVVQPQSGSSPPVSIYLPVVER
jgi:hypothetical protein